MTMPAVENDDEFTELRDATFDRLDGVGKGANGVPRWLIAKQADGGPAGLLDPDLIRDLIGKSTPAPEPPTEDKVTMTGTPGAIFKFIHEAAQRAAPVEKAEMSTADINDLPDSDFAYIEPGGHKDDEGKTVPRSLRHFPINDEAHVRNALSRAPQSPFGDKAMPKIRAEAQRLGIEVAKEMDMADADALDATTALAEPEIDAPGNPTTPGSPAWEAIDAATACKWTAILARARNAVELLADREMLEAASGDDDDACQTMDLADACAAIDYAISVLAPFAVAEHAEAATGEEMAAVGKALAGWDAAALDTIEALGHVKKAGRVLSASNEAAIRGAVESLQKVLASLPAAPEADVAKTAHEEPNMPTPTLAEDVTEASGQEPAMGTAEPMAKADGEKTPMCVVYDQRGRLIGIVDPADVTPVANSEADADDTADDGETEDGDGEQADATPETTDLEPAPAAEVGTPADAVDDDEAVTKSTTTASDEMLKSIADVVTKALAAHGATQEQALAKAQETIAQMAETVETLKGQVKALEEQPAAPKVFTNGAVPPPEMLRGQDRGARPVDVAKAREQKQALYKADAPEQKRIADDMQAAAIAALEAIHRR